MAKPKSAKKLVMDPELPLRAALEAALAGVISFATSWAGRAEETPERAVHVFRKSLRRSRAVLKLMRDSLPTESYVALNEELRNVMRDTSPLRDADVLVTLVEEAPHTKKTTAALEALLPLVAAQRAVGNQPDHVASILRDGAARVQDLPRRFAALLTESLRLHHLAHAVRRSYRRVRRTYFEARESGEDAALHNWRKRVKELRYQLEMLQELTGQTAQHRALADLAEALGQVTDWMILRECIRRHQARLPAEATQRLLALLDDWIETRREELFETQADLFGLKPKRFVEHVLGHIHLHPGESGRLRTLQAGAVEEALEEAVEQAPREEAPPEAKAS